MAARIVISTGGLVAAAAAAGGAAAAPLLGQPTPGGLGLQPGASPNAHAAAFFHNGVLLPVVTVITLFVLGLMIYVMVRFNKRANPVPARFTHNTTIEVVWTVAPVLILLFIAVFSYKLLFAFNDMPRPDLTVKATGYQWNWGYELPDHGVAEFTSVMLTEEQANAIGRPYRLAVDKPLVVPVNKVVRVLITGGDVIHAFGVPAFAFVFDAVPGRINETWFKAEQTGIYYGQCRELCGVDHAFMPIQINVVSEAEFARWVVENGGSMTPRVPEGAADASAAAIPAAATAATATGAAPAGEAPAVTGAAPADAGPAAPAQPASNAASGAAGAQPAPAAQQ